MDALTQRWQVWSMRLDAMSFRERLLVFVAVAGVTLTLIFIGLIEPALKRQEQMMLGVSSLQQEIFTLNGQLMTTEQQHKRGENSENNRLLAEVAMLQQSVKDRESGMVAPDKMIPALKSLLSAQPGLKLVSLHTAAPRPVVVKSETGNLLSEVMAIAKSGAAVSAEQLYKHGIALQVTGSYAQLTDYIERLESLPWAMQWKSMQLDASRHPQLELTLELTTLSRERTWARF